jgi:hypothetical protein
LAAGLEGLDDEHAAAAAGAWVGERLCRCWVGLDRLVGRRWGQVQEFARRGDCVGAIAAGEQAIVADAVEARRSSLPDTMRSPSIPWAAGGNRTSVKNG